MTNLYLELEKYITFNEKRIETIKYDILCFFESIYSTSSYKTEINDYINGCINSTSPKTRKKAKELSNKLFGNHV